MKLIGFKICPYVQRVVIMLHEKGIRHTLEYIDPYGKRPADFHHISPLGKVPVLDIGNDQYLFESAVILEYLDEIKKPPLLPVPPPARARHRSWIVYASSVQALLARLVTVRDEHLFAETQAAIRDHLARIESELRTGPLFSGEHFSLVDAVFAPALVTIDFLESMHRFGFLRGLDKTNRWRETLLARPSVRAAIHNEYRDLMIEFVHRQQGCLDARLGSGPPGTQYEATGASGAP
ncbi:MAG: glutathione S-transferase family protein [Acidiferrobacteraceae bacterium]